MQRVSFSVTCVLHKKRAQGTEIVLAGNIKKYVGVKETESNFSTYFCYEGAEKLRMVNLTCWGVPGRQKLSLSAYFCYKNAMFS